MTLTELRYIIAVSQTHHFGRAAEQCNISQPSLSIAVKKLEKELGVMIFERRTVDVVPTPVGERIIRQARIVLNEAEHIMEIAQVDRDPLNGPLKLGVIYTVSPYLLPELVRRSVAKNPKMPLLLTEDYTVNLLQKLKSGQIDAAILALPVSEPGFMECDLYDEDFVVVVPKHHRLAKEKTIRPAALSEENMLILAQGNCFRDQVLEVCPETMHVGSADGLSHQLEGSSLATIRHMVASGLGISVFPASARNYDVGDSLVTYVDFEEPTPSRRIGIIWRKSFPRTEAIMAVIKACQSIRLEGIQHLPMNPHLIEPAV